MKLENYMYAIIIFSFVITGFGLVYIEMGQTHGATINESYYNAYNKIDQLHNDSLDISSRVREEKTGTVSDWSSLGKNALSAVRMVFGSFGIVNEMVYSIADRIGIPQIAIWVLLSIITLAIAFAIITAIFRFPT